MEMREIDEDYAFEQYRQKRVDAGTWRKPRPLPQFAKDYGVQQYAHHDPAPSLPFSNSWEPPRYTRLEVWTVRALWVVVVAAMVAAEVLS
jgi:hypothetical protein